MDLNGKNVIYIGGFGGIGQKCLAEFLAKGIKNLAIFDLNENVAFMQELQQTYADASIFYVKLDITNRDNIEAAFKEAVAKMGHFDVVVNGSGLMNDRLVDLTIQINLLGLIHSNLIAIPYMDKAEGGRGGLIVNISSVAGLIPSGMFAVYGATKHAVTAFTRSLANPFYYSRTGIGFITICPGSTETALVDSPRDKVTFDYAAPLIKHLEKVKGQAADICAKNLVKAVELANNGAVWILDVDEMKQVEIPMVWTPTLKE